MKLAIMQPYFFPYIGYFQLIHSADVFVVYDNIKYTKKGWINRNRILHDGSDAIISLPLKNASDFLEIRERELAAGFDRDKLLNQIEGAYQKSPYFKEAFGLVENIVRDKSHGLFPYLYQSLVKTCEYVGLPSRFKISSDVPADHSLKSQERVLAICKALGAGTYINASGGVELYSAADFRARGIELRFNKPKLVQYAQLGNEFVPWLSIIDVLMFNSKDKVHEMIRGGYEIT